ncbi:hypothetical protein ATSB10_01970 [Dyella thiooxydans]|uniref:Uncharacterized protein n=1 Tax=Dyella thiooxydans TaxID=445710 RepID=A0A160MWT7_9GAMM|nr:hypothetical protein ATSB10_01970 [Dyella thiooxydans]
MRDALAPFGAIGFRARSFRPPAEGELLLFCLSKREVTKRKRHPAWRLPPIHGRQVREAGSGFSTGLLSGRKVIGVRADDRYAACRPHLTAAQGPRVGQRAILARTRWKAERLKSQSNSKATAKRCFAVALALLRSVRWGRAALSGAPMARRVGVGEAPQGGLAWMRASSTSGQEPCRRTPGTHPRTRRAGCPQGAPSGCPSLWLLSLGQARESDSPSAGGRKLFASRPWRNPASSRLKWLPKAHKSC